jgi:hypothetical protein
MAGELAWPIEAIPSSDFVLMRAHKANFSGRELMPGVFKSHDGGMSVNWDKYASAEETKQQATKNPEDNAVIGMPVMGVRRIDDLRVEHSPEASNRAHSDVLGIPHSREQRTEVRLLLLRIAEIVIPLAGQ